MKIHKKVAEHWDKDAPNWIRVSEKGLDIWRDNLNTKAFLRMLPDVSGLSGLDIGCGEGYNTRLIAERCKYLTAIDISTEFIAYNQKKYHSTNIIFKRANSTELPFEDKSFDFAIATMSLMDMAEIDKVLREIFRTLRPAGFLQFSITHPCFNEYIGHWVEDTQGKREAFMVERYFTETFGDIHEWQHLYAPVDIEPFQTPRFIKPLSVWLNLLIKSGFIIEEVCEPYADENAIFKHPVLSSTLIAAHSLIIRVRK
jgi:ubiquinone/menaquinone biosynthesis C-methylase UbiE